MTRIHPHRTLLRCVAVPLAVGAASLVLAQPAGAGGVEQERVEQERVEQERVEQERGTPVEQERP
jgi:hypothetical protein